MDTESLTNDATIDQDRLSEAKAEYQAHQDSKLVKGRPSKYKPEYCDIVIELGKRGYSRTMMANELDVNWTNFCDWQDRFPLFRHAVKEAMRRSQASYEHHVLESMRKPVGATNGLLTIWVGKNMFGQDWCDRSEVTHTSNQPSVGDLAAAITRELLKQAPQRLRRPKVKQVASQVIDVEAVNASEAGQK